ncbi:MAG: chitobiase/beta-hexosaminidase C-terminal domain-containing protein [Treponema sp.]|nr:chitobiase/beta-hexosaminidase C-terminal domain-containing protein [Treponema sp.]
MSKKTVFAFLLAFSVCCMAFADFTVLNPVSGVWANRQTLLLSMPEDEEAYYSVNGADPLVSGFAYDAPVTLDITGDVEIRIASINSEGKTFYKTVSYTVIEKKASEKEQNFFNSFMAMPVYEYIPGQVIDIPGTLKYSIDSGGQLVFSAARSLSLAENCSLACYVPVIFSDGQNFWRGILHFMPKTGSLAKRYVPFSVEDWTKVSFNDKNFIYCVDDGWWQRSGEVVELDRSVWHIIRWQPVEFNSVNPIQSFELPPKPELYTKKNPDGSQVYSLEGDAWQLAFDSSNKNFADGLFPEICIDALPGQEISGKLYLDVYIENVYQGKTFVSYRIDRKPPRSPAVTASASGFWVRKPLDLKISAEKNEKVFYAESYPLAVEPAFSAPPPDADFFVKAAPGDFKELSDSVIHLSADEERALYRKVYVYSQDSDGNRSEIVEYGVVIDPCNYYFDADSKDNLADGTKMHPFKSFDSLEFGNSLPRYVNLHVRGSVKLPARQIVLPVNCKITGYDDALLEFIPGTSFRVITSSLEITNCLINKNSVSAKEQKNLFVLENSTLSLAGCEVISMFEDSGSIIQAENSSVMLQNCGLISQAKDYAAVISASRSDINVKNSRASAIAQTAVAFSLNGGKFVLRSSACKSVGTIGRIAELMGSKCIITANTFTAELSSPRNSGAVWKDGAVETIEEDSNVIRGFL